MIKMLVKVNYDECHGCGGYTVGASGASYDERHGCGGACWRRTWLRRAVLLGERYVSSEKRLRCGLVIVKVDYGKEKL